MPALPLPLRILATWLVVDLISGTVHWCEDSYGSPATPFVGRRITKPNILHHFRPRAKDSHYCVLTNFLNPVLDASRFWRGLEWLLRRAGIEKRSDDLMLAEVLRQEPDFLDRPIPGAGTGPV